MELKKYVSNEETSYAELASKVGSISSVSIYRYAVGLRKPSHEIVKRIIKATGGKVTAKDFKNIRPPKSKKGENNNKNKTKSHKWLREMLDWHLNGALECELSYDETFEKSSTTLPLTIALRELNERATIHKGKYYLDGRPTSIPHLIEAANQNRLQRGLSKIFYPGC